MPARHHPSAAFQMFRCEERVSPDRWKPVDIKYLATVLPQSQHIGCLYDRKLDQYYCQPIPAQREA